MKGDKSDTGGRSQGHPNRESSDYSPPPARVAAYIPPTQVPKESKYHTLDLKAVRLAPEIDPQRMKTQMGLRRLPDVASSSSDASTWVSWCLAGAALGLGAWWGVQWWSARVNVEVTTPSSERVVLAAPGASARATALQPDATANGASVVVPLGLHDGVPTQPTVSVVGTSSSVER